MSSIHYMLINNLLIRERSQYEEMFYQQLLVTCKMSLRLDELRLQHAVEDEKRGRLNQTPGANPQQTPETS